MRKQQAIYIKISKKMFTHVEETVCKPQSTLTGEK